jgi:hypothetical protein
MEKYVVDAEVNAQAEVENLNVTDEVKDVNVKVKTAPTVPPPPVDEFWIVFSAVSGLLMLLVAL